MIEGMDKLLKDFHKMDLDKKAVKKILIRAASPMLSAAKQKSHSKTVARSLGWITKNDNKYPMTVLMGVRSGFGTETMTAAALASIQEFGSVLRFKEDGSKTGFVKPQQFMRPAFDENKGHIKETIIEGLTELIDKQAKKNNIK